MKKQVLADHPAFDIKRLIYDSNSTFNPLHQDSLFECHAAGVRDGRVLLNVALPCEMSRFFVAFLESMIGFFRVMDIKSRSAAAEVRSIDPIAIEERERSKQEYAETVCSLFDGFVADGKSSKESVKLTNLALKAKSHPWATYGLVSGVLRSQGKLRKNNRVTPGKDSYR